jgi:phospholipid-binding lipoprotein MlaA
MRRVALLLTLALSGCATAPGSVDPYERFNRGVYQFNERADKAVLQPAARAYRFVIPEFVRTSIGNVFSNIGDVRAVLNNALQGKFSAASADFGRVALNSTWGILGLFDIASEAGIEKSQEDFGQTLGWWGLGDGPFLMLPLLGPSTGRDAFGLVVDFVSDPVTYVNPAAAHNQLAGGRIVNRRAELLEASTLLGDAALDPYLFLRDAYLQRRRSLVQDGASPANVEAMYRSLHADGDTTELAGNR